MTRGFYFTNYILWLGLWLVGVIWPFRSILEGGDDTSNFRLIVLYGDVCVGGIEMLRVRQVKGMDEFHERCIIE